MTTVPTPNPNNLAYIPTQQVSTVGRGAKTSYTPAAAGTCYLDCNATSSFLVQMPAGNITIEMVNYQPGQKIQIAVKQDSVGSRTVTWINCAWASGSPPSLSTVASRTDIIELMYDDVTLKWSGWMPIKYAA